MAPVSYGITVADHLTYIKRR